MGGSKQRLGEMEEGKMFCKKTSSGHNMAFTLRNTLYICGSLYKIEPIIIPSRNGEGHMRPHPYLKNC